ncbi:outer membrane beta-barrel family protein [Fluviicola sp.]|jgi:hypothetical protein|uniref:outer membrane beta-barrel family protein n=1 Tax=Fluviicola sp. TaxID=1917219 RepID=UPI00281DFA4B|nr:outer membrane beta-barrel family protein [Fluviicola sp.]MDR0802298.1 outer membrane beta-barrel family protein [Fluviicola sp.]
MKLLKLILTKVVPNCGIVLFRTILITLFFNFFGYSYGQSVVKGRLKIADGGDCVFAKLELRKVSDSLLLFYAFSDSIGQFEFNLIVEPIDVFLFITQAEIRDTVIRIIQPAEVKTIDLGLLNLNPNSHQLNLVEITGKPPLIEKKIDRLVFNIENTSNSSGRNVLELLSKTPLVFVQNRSISVVGKAGLAFLINEKRIYLEGDDLVQYLESIPSEEVVRIEVLTNPPSKYDASGSAIINIVLKKNRMLGTNGSLTASYTQAFYGAERLSFMLNHRGKKFNVYGTLSGRNGENRYNEKSDYSFSSSFNRQNDITNRYSQGMRGTIGLDYYFSSKSNLSVSWEGSVSVLKNQSTAESIYGYGSIIDSTAYTFKRNATDLYFQSVNASWQYKLDSTGRSLNFVANYFYNNTDLANNFDFQNYSGDTLNSFESMNSGSVQLVNLAVIDVEYQLPSKIGNFSIGAKFNWIGNNNNNSMTHSVNNNVFYDTLQNSRFLYTEQTEAFYTSYNKQWDKDEIQLGIRGEYTQLIGKQDIVNSQTKRVFFNLFPTIYYLHKFSGKHTVSISYGMRIDRPGFTSLNPFRRYVTNRIYNIGNPQLRPTYITDAEIDYVLNDRYYLGLLYTNFANSYMEAPKDELNNIVYTQENIGNTNQYGGFVNIPFNLGEKIENSIVLVYLFSTFKPKASFYEASSTSILFCNFNSSITITKGLSADVNFSARPLGSIYTISNMKSQYILGFGLTQKFLEGRLILSVNISDLFKNSAPKSDMRTSTFSIYTNNYYDSRNIAFSLSYKFGNKYIRQRKQNKGSESERNRI